MAEKEQGEGKKCPWGMECEKCRLSIEMMSSMNGLQKKYMMCSLTAMVTILSELNAKTQVKQETLSIPRLYGG
jgi:hypothetical protein